MEKILKGIVSFFATTAADAASFALFTIKSWKKLLSLTLVSALSLYIIFRLFLPEAAEHPGRPENIAAIAAFIAVVIVWYILFMYVMGPVFLHSTYTARKICREDDKRVVMPAVEMCISEARRDGLDLPDKINVYISEKEYPLVRAASRHSIVISRGMMEYAYSGYLETMIYSELYRISNREPGSMYMRLPTNGSPVCRRWGLITADLKWVHHLTISLKMPKIAFVTVYRKGKDPRLYKWRDSDFLPG